MFLCLKGKISSFVDLYNCVSLQKKTVKFVPDFPGEQAAACFFRPAPMRPAPPSQYTAQWSAELELIGQIKRTSPENIGIQVRALAAPPEAVDDRGVSAVVGAVLPHSLTRVRVPDRHRLVCASGE